MTPPVRRTFGLLSLGLALAAVPPLSFAGGAQASRALEAAALSVESETPILRCEHVLGARLLGASGDEVARLHDVIVHRKTGLVTRAVVRVFGTNGGALKAVPYTELSWDAGARALRVDASVADLKALADFDPARIARASARWTRRGGAAKEEQPQIVHLLARHQLGRELFRAEEQLGDVGTLYIAPTEGRVVAWGLRRTSGTDVTELLLPWPVVQEAPHGEQQLPRLGFKKETKALDGLVRFAPAAPRDLGSERPRLRALFRTFGEDPPNVLLAPAQRTLLSRR